MFWPFLAVQNRAQRLTIRNEKAPAVLELNGGGRVLEASFIPAKRGAGGGSKPLKKPLSWEM